jgi:hypothetical protein
MMLSFMQVVSNLTGTRMNYEVSVRDSSGASSRTSNTIVPQSTAAPMDLNMLLESVVEATISTPAPPESKKPSVQEQLTELQTAYQALEARMRALEAKLTQQETAPLETAPLEPAAESNAVPQTTTLV